jgi:electron transport complex protein RnfC
MNFLSLHTNTFKNGIHPPENKDDTKGLPIRQFPFATELIIPMTQHIGAPAEIIVREGQEVARGQMIAKAAGYVSVPIHSPSRVLSKKFACTYNFRNQSCRDNYRSFSIFRTGSSRGVLH